MNVFEGFFKKHGKKRKRGSSLCIVCKGSRLLCGKKACPLLIRLSSQIKSSLLIRGRELNGSSPPSLFVGRIGYPKVYVGPLVPPIDGDTSLFDTPELWHGKTIQQIVDFRCLLVRGKVRVNVKDVENKFVEKLQELALSRNSVSTELEFTKKPRQAMVLSDVVQPFGPSAPVKQMKIFPDRTDHKVEKVHDDWDMKAEDAVFWLYRKGVLVSKIQRAFSAGLLGVYENRRLVPTRWSITAVDDIISRRLLENVKQFPSINEYRVYEHTYLDNRWIVLMIPSFWSYEQMEAWYPGTTWNPDKGIWVVSDWEGFEGRSDYALTGGCYYSTRLAVAEHLEREGRQAAVITFREIHPGYVLPVGVWFTRESIRKALEKQPQKFDSLKDALKYISTKLDVPINEWINNSNFLKRLMYQRKIVDFFKKLQSRNI